jgi:hypothetical protein
MPQLSELVKAAGDTAINGRISFLPTRALGISA